MLYGTTLKQAGIGGGDQALLYAWSWTGRFCEYCQYNLLQRNKTGSSNLESSKDCEEHEVYRLVFQYS